MHFINKLAAIIACKYISKTNSKISKYELKCILIIKTFRIRIFLTQQACKCITIFEYKEWIKINND